MEKISKKEEIIKYILKKISNNELRENDKLMTEQELCVMFDVSRMTAHQAMVDLANSGHITRVAGRGSFVSRKPLLRYINARKSFTSDMSSIGLTAGASILEYRKTLAENYPEAITELGLRPDEEVYFFCRLRTGDGKPIAIQKTYIPVKMIEDFDVNALTSSLQDYLESRGLVAEAFETKLKAILANDEEMRLLRLPKNSALLLSRSYRYLKDGRLFEYTETYYRADSYEYSYSSSIKSEN